MKLSKTLLISLIVLTILQPSQSKATCDESLGLCQKTVKDLQNDNLLIKQRMATIQKQRDEAESQLNKAEEAKLFPAWAWLLIGAGAGIGIYAAIRK